MSEYLDWTTLSDDPNDSESKRRVKRYLLGARRLHLDTDLLSLVMTIAKSKRVLDVGMVSHAVRYVEDPGWRHDKLRAVASYCLGVDVLAPLVQALDKRGYNVRCVDATSDEDLGERFDVVFVGDVIEHVDNAAALLRFGRRHLAEGGAIWVATPNPFSRKFFRRFRHEGVVMVNLDHVSWVTPTMALELGRRAGLALHAYHLVKLIAPWKRSLKRIAWRYTPPDYTFPDYLYEFRVPVSRSG